MLLEPLETGSVSWWRFNWDRNKDLGTTGLV